MELSTLGMVSSKNDMLLTKEGWYGLTTEALMVWRELNWSPVKRLLSSLSLLIIIIIIMIIINTIIIWLSIFCYFIDLFIITYLLFSFSFPRSWGLAVNYFRKMTCPWGIQQKISQEHFSHPGCKPVVLETEWGNYSANHTLELMVQRKYHQEWVIAIDMYNNLAQCAFLMQFSAGMIYSLIIAHVSSVNKPCARLTRFWHSQLDCRPFLFDCVTWVSGLLRNFTCKYLSRIARHFPNVSHLCQGEFPSEMHDCNWSIYPYGDWMAGIRLSWVYLSYSGRLLQGTVIWTT